MWYQPLLLLGVVAVSLPVTLRRSPEEHLWVGVSMLGAMAVASVVAWLAGSRLGHRGRALAGWGLVTLGAVALLLVSSIAIPDRPEHVLPFAAGVAATVAPAGNIRLRLPVQVLVVAGMAVLLFRAQRSMVEVVLTTLLLGFVVWLSGIMAQTLLDTRRAQKQARLAAERRAELLAAVRDLSGRGSTDAARVVSRSLSSLGLTMAGVSVEREGLLVPVALEGLSPSARLGVGEGLAGAAFTENRGIVSGDYPRDPRRHHERANIGSAIAVPIRIEGEPVGVVFGGREQVGPPPAEVVEVAEVLAAHLGGVLETEQRLDRQRELLERMQALEDMREGLVSDVSEEVRDPLTVVRGIAETLVLHADRLPAERRQQLLRSFEEQAGTLRATIDALLDFSRTQSGGTLPVLGLARPGRLLVRVFGEAMVEGDLDAVARADPSLLIRTMEILQSLGMVRRVRVEADEDEVVLRLDSDLYRSLPRSRLLLGIAERLIVSANGRWQMEGESVLIHLPKEHAVVADAGARSGAEAHGGSDGRDGTDGGVAGDGSSVGGGR